jgi:hypothetical protein
MAVFLNQAWDVSLLGLYISITGAGILKRLIEIDESIEDMNTHITVPPD